MGRRASGKIIEIQPGLYLKSHDGLLHCYFRVEGRAFRRSTCTDDFNDAKQRAVAWYRAAQLRASLGEKIETVSFVRLAAAYAHHISGLSKAHYHLPTMERHFLPYFRSFRDITNITTAELMTYVGRMLSPDLNLPAIAPFSDTRHDTSSVQCDTVVTD